MMKAVKDLQLGETIVMMGVVRSIVPATGGQLHVLVEDGDKVTTFTWDPHIKVAVGEPPSTETPRSPGWWIVVDTYGNSIRNGRGDLAKHHTFDEALVEARRWATTNVGKKCAIVKLVSSIWAHYGEPIAEREDFS